MRSRRGADHDLVHSGGSCRYDTHEHRARVGGGPAGGVDAHVLERDPAACDAHAWFDIDRHALWELRLMKATNVRGSPLKRRAHVGLKSLDGQSPLGTRDLHHQSFYAVESCSHLDQGHVAFASDVGHQ